jgi:ribosomal protein L23
MTISVYSVFVNNVAIPIKASSLEYGKYSAASKGTVVIYNGQRDKVASEDLEKPQMIKFDMPEFYQGVDVSSVLTAQMKNGNANITLKKEGVTINYKACAISELGEFKDDGENMASVTIEGIHQSKLA